MAPGYVVVQVSVADPVAYRAYVAAVTPVTAKFGGEYLTRGGASETVEGTAPGERVVVIRFPSLQAARDWYFSDDYAEIKKMRQAASTGVVTLVEGV